MPDNVLVAKESFTSDVLGYPRPVRVGETFRAGHKLTEAHPSLFKPFRVDNDLDEVAVSNGKRNVTRAQAPTSQE